jgi:MFS family permease
MSDAAAGRPPLPRIVKQFGAVSFLNDLASEMVYPLLPALVTGLGGTAVHLGIMDGVAEAASAGVKLRSGRLAEHSPWRRPLVELGYVVAAVARPVIGLATAPWQVVALRATDRLGKGARTPPRDALIADATPPALHGRAYGLHRGMDHAGAAVGPLVAWAMMTGLARAPGQVAIWSVVPGALAVAFVMWALRSAPVAQVEEPAETLEATAVPGAVGTSQVFALIVTFAFIRMPETLILLRLQDEGLAVAAIPLAWAGLHVVRTAASYPGGWLSDRAGARRTMVLGWALYAVLCIGLGVTTSATIALTLLLAFGLVSAATESPERAFVAAAGVGARRGRRFGAYHALVGLVALPGSVLLGVIYQRLGGPTALSLSGIAAMGLAGLGLIVRDDGTLRSRRNG